jgi:tetratricopeptide (TPR) repeat protein
MNKTTTPELMNHLDAAIRLFPDTPSIHLLTFKAYAKINLGQYDEAKAILSDILARDSLVPHAYQGLFFIAHMQKDHKAIDLYKGLLRRSEPWFVDANEQLIRSYYLKNR